MVTWAEFAATEPDFSARVLALFTPYRHHTMATVRRDGSPRISGTEIVLEGGELVLGMMTGTRRAADLRRDPRLAIHSHSVDPPEDDPGSWPGEAKVSGRALPCPSGESVPGDAESFRVDISEVALTRLGEPADHLVVESWLPGRGLRSQRR